MSDHWYVAAENPFTASRVRPGAIGFIFDEQPPLDSLLTQLRASGYWGQIVGAHGSGKSALLATLRAGLEASGLGVLHLELHAGQRRLPLSFRKLRSAENISVIVVDGYEQLSWLARMRLKHFCRRRKLGLLVSTHRPAGFPTLCTLRPGLPLAQKLAAQLQQGYRELVTPTDVAACYAAAHGDLREMFFALYDIYEQRMGNLGKF